MPDLQVLKNYSGSIVRDIAADKNIPGQLRRYPSQHQMHNAISYYLVYKRYLSECRPDFIFFPIIESHEGMILYAIARELGIPTVFHASTRNLHQSFFSSSPNEDLPPYVLGSEISQTHKERARKIVDEFEQRPFKAVEFTYQPTQADVIDFPQWLPLRKKLWRLPKSFWNLVRDVRSEPHSARPHPLWFQPYMYFGYANKTVARWKASRRRRFTSIFDVGQLPQRYLYYALHLTPELTVTTMAPYFEDQLRAIDLIRYNMPSDHMLVIKEHPLMIGKRPMHFYKAIALKAGVAVADIHVPSVELIRRASLTVSVTGTAAFEALMLGKPSLVLAKTFFSPWTARFQSFERLNETIAQAIALQPAEIKEKAVDCVSRTLAAAYDCVLYDPYNPDLDATHTMNRRNVANFLHGLLDHLRRVSESAAPPSASVKVG